MTVRALKTVWRQDRSWASLVTESACFCLPRRRRSSSSRSSSSSSSSRSSSRLSSRSRHNRHGRGGRDGRRSRTRSRSRRRSRSYSAGRGGAGSRRRRERTRSRSNDRDRARDRDRDRRRYSSHRRTRFDSSASVGGFFLVFLKLLFKLLTYLFFFSMADHGLAHDRGQGEGVEAVEATGAETATAAVPHSLWTVLTTVPPPLTEEPSPLPSPSVTSWESKTTTWTLLQKQSKRSNWWQ